MYPNRNVWMGGDQRLLTPETGDPIVFGIHSGRNRQYWGVERFDGRPYSVGRGRATKSVWTMLKGL